MKGAFRLYEWLGPLLLVPLAWWLWMKVAPGNAALATVALAVPVVHGYVVPAVGTNVLKVWGFTARLRIGQFRPQHGFLFGGATSAITGLLFLVLGPEAGVTERVMVAGAVLLAINWIYDALAIRHGILVVRNQPWAEGRSIWAISGDYVVWFFGLAGAIYAAVIDRALHRLPSDATVAAVIAWVAGGALVTMLAPTVCHVLASRLRHGHSGWRPVAGRD